MGVLEGKKKLEILEISKHAECFDITTRKNRKRVKMEDLYSNLAEAQAYQHLVVVLCTYNCSKRKHFIFSLIAMLKEGEQKLCSRKMSIE